MTKQTGHRDMLAEAKAAALAKGGECLSESYVNKRTKLRWRCDKGHEWDALPGHVRNGNWCGRCAGKGAPITVDEGQKLAEARGGQCLAKLNTKGTARFKWRCDRGHEWEAVWHSVRDGSWCPACAGKIRYTIEDAKTLAKNRGGECLSDTYVRSEDKLRWRCFEGHEWNATWDLVKARTWCPYCAGQGRLTLDDARRHAAERGGECLSEECVNSTLPMRWRCGKGHEWETSLASVRAGSWCPDCSGGYSERTVRAIMERMFSVSFPKSKPSWLVKGNSRLELDGYSVEKQIAFEYQGYQHFQQAHFYGHDIETVANRDMVKRRLCWERGVALVVVPHLPGNAKLDAYINQVELAVLAAGIKIPKWKRPNALPEVDDPLESVFGGGRIRELREIAKSKGGSLVSTVAARTTGKLLWRCSQGHEWNARADGILKRYWCRRCSGLVPLTIDDAKAAAASHGGVCLSEECTNRETKLIWQCAIGHQWETTLGVVKQGSWCPTCSGVRRLTINDAYRIAAERGGRCISDRLVNRSTKLTWQCAQGHTWEATLGAVKQKTWCPHCANALRRWPR